MSSQQDPKSLSALYRILGIGILLAGDLVVLVGQARAEMRLLYDLEADASTLWRVFGWLASTGLLALLSWGLGRWILIWRDETYPNPKTLFRQLCRAHGLPEKEQQQLEEWAQQSRIDDPTRLFIDPSIWGQVAQAVAGQADLQVEQQKLKQRLVGIGS